MQAFQRALDAVEALSEEEFAALVATGRWTDLSGVGASSARIITESLAADNIDDFDSPVEGTYLADLAHKTELDAGQGASVRAQLLGDLHAHTVWSDGGATLDEMVAAAQALGHQYLAITDHSPRLKVANGLSVERLAQQRAEIDAVNAAMNDSGAQFWVLAGIEVDILDDGSLDAPDEVLAQLDIVVASVHSTLRMERAPMTERLVIAASNPHVDVLGHVTGRKVAGPLTNTTTTGRGRGPRDPSTFDAELVFTACAQGNTSVELNCRPERQDPPDELVRTAMDAGCTFAINSDAHSPGQLEWVTHGCERAATLGISADRIRNCASDPTALIG